MGDESPRLYELACLEVAIHTFLNYWPASDRFDESQRRAFKGLAFVDVKLVGSYPETRLVVVVDDYRTGLREAHGYRLWGDLFRNPDGSPGDPQWVTDALTTWLEEPMDPADPQRGEVEILAPEPEGD